MTSLKKVFFVLFMLTAIHCLPCEDTDDCIYLQGEQLTEQTVYPFVDEKLREHYWYYLRGADLLYRANIGQVDTFVFLSIYRNIVGTFLVITTWQTGATSVQVNTFVRLGNGYGRDSGARYQPVSLEPFSISITLGDGEYLIDNNNPNGQIQVNGQVLAEGFLNSGNAEGTGQGLLTRDQINAKCNSFNSALEKRYWYYIRDSTKTNISGRMTNKRIICFSNYIGIAGAHFIISSINNESENYRVNTFVRIGSGINLRGESVQIVQGFEPATLDLNLLKSKHNY